MLSTTRVIPRFKRWYFKRRATRKLNHINQGSYIGPEIFYDNFAEIIINICARKEVQTLIEIGSSSGEGSTSAIVKGLKHKKNWVLHLLEVDSFRLENLRITLGRDSRVKISPYSSIALSEFPTEKEVSDFYNSKRTNMNRYSLSTILSWYRGDIDAISKLPYPEVCGIEEIKRQHVIVDFDFALIDGSEFTGFKDLSHLIGAKYILLDDINAYKCFDAYQQLKNDSRYQLLVENWKLRNGFAVFQKING